MKTVKNSLEVLEKSLNFTQTSLYEPWLPLYFSFSELTSRGEEKNLLENRVEELRQIQEKCELEIVTLQATLKHSEELAGDTNNRYRMSRDVTIHRIIDILQ